MKTKTLNQQVYFNASPDVIYEMLMDEQKHGAFTESNVIMSREAQGKFSVFDGYCHGHNIELQEGKKIVQAWHFDEEDWPDNHYSTCTFELLENHGGTKLHFSQSEIPESLYDDLAEGWNNYYWDAMIAWLEG